MVWQFLKKLNIELPYDPAIPLPGIYPREVKTYIGTLKNLYLNVDGSINHDSRKGWGRMNTGMCVAESLHCSPETITTSLIGCTPTQNVFGVKKRFRLWSLKIFEKQLKS